MQSLLFEVCACFNVFKIGVRWSLGQEQLAVALVHAANIHHVVALKQTGQWCIWKCTGRRRQVGGKRGHREGDAGERERRDRLWWDSRQTNKQRERHTYIYTNKHTHTYTHTHTHTHTRTHTRTYAHTHTRTHAHTHTRTHAHTHTRTHAHTHTPTHTHTHTHTHRQTDRQTDRQTEGEVWNESNKE